MKFHLLLLQLAAAFFASVACGQPPHAPSAEEARKAAKEVAVERGYKLMKDLGLLDKAKYVAFAIDREDSADILKDSDIEPMIPPIMLRANLIMVFFVANPKDSAPMVGVYIDRKLGALRGYLICPKNKDQ